MKSPGVKLVAYLGLRGFASLLLLFNLRNATFFEYVIYRVERFVFSEVICGEEGERSREFIVYLVVTHQLRNGKLIYFIK